MKMFLKILYGLLLLGLLLVIIVIMGGIVFNICNPHVKGMSQTFEKRFFFTYMETAPVYKYSWRVSVIVPEIPLNSWTSRGC